MTCRTQPLYNLRIGVAKDAISLSESDNHDFNGTFTRICLDSECNEKVSIQKSGR